MSKRRGFFDDFLFGAVTTAQVIRDDSDPKVDPEVKIVYIDTTQAAAIAIPRFMNAQTPDGKDVVRQVVFTNIGQHDAEVSYEGGTIGGQRALLVPKGKSVVLSSVPSTAGGAAVEFAIIIPPI